MGPMVAKAIVKAASSPAGISTKLEAVVPIVAGLKIQSESLNYMIVKNEVSILALYLKYD